MGRTVRLEQLYFNPKSTGSLGGIDRLHRAAGKRNYTRKEIVEWLRKQDVYTLHKPVQLHFNKRRTLVSKIDDVWQMDLVDMQKYKKENDNYGYILTCIDVFSKYAWAVPIERKSSLNTVKAINKILAEGRQPTKIQTDLGTEFTNQVVQRFLKKKNIGYYTTFGDSKAAVIERFNRTLKSRMWRLFTHIGTHRYIDALTNLLNSYNNSYHRSIKMTPSQVQSSNESTVQKNLFPPQIKTFHPKFHIGDRVRISKLKATFDKGYLPNWSDEVFTIVATKATTPPTYEIKDDKGEVLKGAFYEEELQKIDKSDQDLWRIEKILKERVANGKKQVLVKWQGYSDLHNSWIDASEIVQLNGIRR